MALTVFDILLDVWDRLMLGPRPTYFDTTDDTQRQLLALLNEEGQQLTLDFPWQRLVQSVVTEAADDDSAISDQGEVEDLCPGLSRFVDDCLYLDGRAIPLIGPLSISDRTFMESGGMTMLYGFFIQNDHLYITSPTTYSQTLRFAYISKHWAKNAKGEGLERVTEGDDVPVLDARLLTLGVVMRWLSRNGLPYQQEFLNYDHARRQLQAADTPKTVLCAGGRSVYNPRRSIVGGMARPWA